MATFEFISLRCVAQNELDGDEIYVCVGGAQVLPPAGIIFFKTGRQVVNPLATLSEDAVDALLGAEGAVSILDFGDVSRLSPVTVPQQGLGVEVWEKDVVSREDKMGSVLVTGQATEGPVTRRLEDALTGVYELTWQVLEDGDE